ncbi:MAG: hypothetical protein AABY37_00305 [Actinomycetota bacterium]
MVMDSGVPKESRRNLLLKLAGIAVASSVLTFAVTWALTSSREVSVTFVQPKDSTQSTANTASANPAASGRSALTETELRSAVKTLGGSVYWAGSMSGALYTLNHVTDGQDFVRYLPNGKGLADTKQDYRVIATYKDAKAFETMQKAGELTTGVSVTNADGSLAYYAKATPTHVYLAYKDLPFQIEIFDPAPGAALKLATTPGSIKKIG